MGTSECKSQVFFEKNQYYLGETANVRVIVDNSQCAKDIKSVKFKLLRSYKGYEGSGIPGHYSTQSVSYLFSQKFEGLKAGEKAERTMSLQIPVNDT